MASNSDEIVPQIIEQAPQNLISVVYENDKQVIFGHELTPSDVKNPPISITWQSNPSKFYTLLFIDPDAPTRKFPIASQVKHWLIVNIPGNDLNSGQVLCEYTGSGPPKRTGLHRYVFLVFEHEGKIEFDEKYVGKEQLSGRMWFNVKSFMKKYGFEEVFAWNYFKAKWDLTVDEKRRCVLI